LVREISKLCLNPLSASKSAEERCNKLPFRK
jgi:hypothetical protein